MSRDAFDFSFLVGSEVPVRHLKAGATIFKEGDPAAEVYVVMGRNHIALFAARNRCASTRMQRARGN